VSRVIRSTVFRMSLHVILIVSRGLNDALSLRVQVVFLQAIRGESFITVRALIDITIDGALKGFLVQLIIQLLEVQALLVQVERHLRRLGALLFLHDLVIEGIVHRLPVRLALVPEPILILVLEYVRLVAWPVCQLSLILVSLEVLGPRHLKVDTGNGVRPLGVVD